MDHQQEIINIQLESTMVSEDHHRNDGFIDEPEHSQQEEHDNTNYPRRPLHLETPEDGAEISHDDIVHLPRMLKLLFGLNGLSLSLLTLPIMYILNTRVAVPLAYLPAYGAIAFLPYSLKPMYAYLCGLWAGSKSSSVRDQNLNENNRHRYLSLFCWLLALNSICTLLFASIPKGGVMAVFVVAFLRGVTDSWAEFCLGLTLIDHAQVKAQSNNNNNNNNNNYETIVSGLQAQSATAGNLGAWLASLITCLVLVGRRLASQEVSETPRLTGALANALVMATALVQVGGAASVYIWEKNQSINTNNTIYEELPSESRFPNDNSNTAAVPTESDSLRDDESSHPSYSSLEDLSDEEASLSTEGSNLIPANDSSWSPKRITNWALVILLQCILVVIALKGPIVEVSSHFLWGVLVVTLLVGIVLASITLCCKIDNGNKATDTTTYRVGLFLVLKNAIPSESAILASFFYSLFGTNQPLLLQFLSFLGMGVSSLSSWSYTRIFSKKFGSGRPLVMLLAATVGLASMASLLHVSVFRIYQNSDSDSNEDNNASPSHKLLLMAVLSKFVTTFFYEWAFLPELVLATTSVKVPTNASQSTVAIEDPEAGVIVSNAPVNQGNEDKSNTEQQRIAMEYGTLVSCIDFGDQLGSLLAAPLVAAWQISRDNGFLHLDRLIVFCSVANVTVTLGLLPLLWNIGKSKR